MERLRSASFHLRRLTIPLARSGVARREHRPPSLQSLNLSSNPFPSVNTTKRIQLVESEACGNSNPLNRTYELDGVRVGRDLGQKVMAEIRTNGSYESAASWRSGGLQFFQYFGNVKA